MAQVAEKPWDLPDAQSLAEEFLDFALTRGVLLLGSFTTKAGRLSPYFLNAGLFNHGDSLRELGKFYAEAIEESGVAFDGLYGPAYKGIPLVASTAIAFAQMEENYPYTYNRKEVKDHGEGGVIIGAPLKGRVWVVDDVISAGTSVRESVEIIEAAGAKVCALAVLLDRQEKGKGELSAVQEAKQKYGIQVVSVATLTDLLSFLSRARDQGTDDRAGEIVTSIEAYRDQYGVTD